MLTPVAWNNSLLTTRWHTFGHQCSAEIRDRSPSAWLCCSGHGQLPCCGQFHLPPGVRCEADGNSLILCVGTDEEIEKNNDLTTGVELRRNSNFIGWAAHAVRADVWVVTRQENLHNAKGTSTYRGRPVTHVWMFGRYQDIGRRSRKTHTPHGWPGYFGECTWAAGEEEARGRAKGWSPIWLSFQAGVSTVPRTWSQPLMIVIHSNARLYLAAIGILHISRSGQLEVVHK